MNVVIETSGCAYNQADSETLAGLLELHGHRIVTRPDDADVVILNTCTVKDDSFRDFQRRLAQLDRAAQPTVIAGCIPAAYPADPRWTGRVVVGVNNLADIALAVELAAANRQATFLDDTPTPDRLDLPATPASPTIDVVPISQGCLSNCAFCETKLARGPLVSFPLDAICRRIETALERGAREIWLTSQDTAAYGRDRGLRLADLLRRVLAIPGEFRVRLGMANPLYLRGQWEALADALASDRFFQFVHLPLQSGSDAVLRRMKRGHGVDEWIRLCRRLRGDVPGLTIATDVIVGFPGETDADFDATLRALDVVRPEVVNRSRYSARPLTAAAAMKPVVAGPVVRERSIRLDRMARRLARESLASLVGQVQPCLIDQQRRRGSVLARTPAYRPVAIPIESDDDAESLLGRVEHVRFRDVENWHLTGHILDPAFAEMTALS